MKKSEKSDFLVRVEDSSTAPWLDDMAARFSISFWIDNPSLNGRSIGGPAGMSMYDDHMEDVFPELGELYEDGFDEGGEGFLVYYGFNEMGTPRTIDDIRQILADRGFNVEGVTSSNIKIKKVKELAGDKVKTEDCVDAIVDFYLKQQTFFEDFNTEPKYWKRVSKKGSGVIYRVFKNTKTNKSVTVEATETEILKVYEDGVVPSSAPASTTDGDDLLKDFPFKSVHEFATIYTKKKLGDWEVSEFTAAEMKEDHYSKYTLPKGTRIGYLDGMDEVIVGVIVATKPMNYYSYDKEMICDGIITFEVDTLKGMVPSQEPVDLLITDFENGGGGLLEDHLNLKKLAKEYKLNHFLCGV